MLYTSYLAGFAPAHWNWDNFVIFEVLQYMWHSSDSGESTQH